MRTCPKCRSVGPAGASFCAFCGATLAPPSQIPPVVPRVVRSAQGYPGLDKKLPVAAGAVGLFFLLILNAVVCNGVRTRPVSAPVTSAQAIAPPTRPAPAPKVPRKKEEPEPAWVQTVRDIQTGKRPAVLPGYERDPDPVPVREEPSSSYASSSDSAGQEETYYPPTYPRRSSSSSWNSSAHPRDSRGRFTRKPGSRPRRRR